jgi:hypothetical protein
VTETIKGMLEITEAAANQTNKEEQENVTGAIKGMETTKAATNRTKEEQSSWLLLSVPFYVYDELDWSNMTIGGNPVSAVTGKHTNDYWFLQTSLRHPMRTRDPAQAKLFVVPILMNIYDNMRKYFKE